MEHARKRSRVPGVDVRPFKDNVKSRQQQQQQQRSGLTKRVKRVDFEDDDTTGTSAAEHATCTTAAMDASQLGSSSSADAASSAGSSAASVASDADEYCFICMNGFSSRRPRMPIPCANKCNQHPVHAKCIYEWRECKSGRNQSSCPLCRGALGEIAYVPRDKIGSHRFRDNFSARKDFITSPVPQHAGVVRCYVRAICDQGVAVRYELFLQAPTTLRYPLGPLPSLETPKYGDQLLAISHKRPESESLFDPDTVYGLSAQLDISMDDKTPPGGSINRGSAHYLGHVASSFRGLEHTIYGADGVVEIGAVRYTQNRVGPAVGPRRIHVCFPSLERTPRQKTGAARSRYAHNDDELDAIVPDPEHALENPESKLDCRRARKSAWRSDSRVEDQNSALRTNYNNHSLDSNFENEVDASSSSSNNNNNNNNEEDDGEDEDDEEIDLTSGDQADWNTRSHLPINDQERLGSSLRRAATQDSMFSSSSSSTISSAQPASRACNSNFTSSEQSETRHAQQQQQQFIFGANKTPYWLPTISAFSLDFCGRVTLPSNKNFQLMINGNPNVALQFGKVAENANAELFTLDVSWPLSPLQAFGVALSACDRKLLCSSI